MFTRRNFGFMAVGAGAIGAFGAASPVRAQHENPPNPFDENRAGDQRPLIKSSTFAGVKLGCNTGSLQTNVQGAIADLVILGIGAAELNPTAIEPQFSPGVRMGGSYEETPIGRFNRDLIRRWRLGVPIDLYVDVGRRFRNAGIELNALNQRYFDDFTDEEIDRTFDQAKALGTDLISAVAPVPTLERMNTVFNRLDAFAQRRKMRVGIHNDIYFPDLASYEAVMKGKSDYTGFTFDMGFFAHFGADPIAMLKRNASRIFNVHIKDMKKGGGNTPFGTGDAPIVEVLRWIRDNNFKAPANIEEESSGSDHLQLVRLALEYCRKALLS